MLAPAINGGEHVCLVIAEHRLINNKSHLGVTADLTGSAWGFNIFDTTAAKEI